MAKELTTYGNIKKGVLSIVERGQFVNALAAFTDCEVTITVKRIGQNRSSPQHRYYFGVVVPLIRDCFNESQGEVFDKDEVHEWLKKEFNSYQVDTENGYTVSMPRSTRKMDTVEFAEYIERCRNWAASFFGINIPDPVKISTTKAELKA